MENDQEKYEFAKKLAKRKIVFFRHLIIYVVVISLLVIINNMTYGGYQWWLWAALGWGIGIVCHFIEVFMFNGSKFEDKMIQKEYERLKNSN